MGLAGLTAQGPLLVPTNFHKSQSGPRNLQGKSCGEFARACFRLSGSSSKPEQAEPPNRGRATEPPRTRGGSGGNRAFCDSPRRLSADFDARKRLPSNRQGQSPKQPHTLQSGGIPPPQTKRAAPYGTAHNTHWLVESYSAQSLPSSAGSSSSKSAWMMAMVSSRSMYSPSGASSVAERSSRPSAR